MSHAYVRLDETLAAITAPRGNAETSDTDPIANLRN